MATICLPHFRPLIVPIFISFVVLLTASCGKNPPPPPPLNEVEFVVVQPQTVMLSTDLPGRTSAYRVAEVRPQINGVIQKRLFTEGATVKAGSQLYQVDPAPYQAALNSARASLKKAQANAVAAQATVDRYKPLVNARAVSHQDLDNAVSALGQAQADVAGAKASIQTADINLEYTKVSSPINGHTGRSTVTEGALVTANQANSLVTVQQLDPMYVDVTQPSTTLLRLQRQLAAGQLKKSGDKAAEVKLMLEDGTPYASPGSLKFSEVTVDQGTGSVTLRAEFPNPDGVLLPGMFVHERIEEGINQSALLVPQQGVSHDQKGNPTALVLGSDGRPQLRMLKTDRAIGDNWLVSDGLKPGDKVIVQGQIGIAMAPSGTPVNAKEITLDQLRHSVVDDSAKGGATGADKGHDQKPPTGDDKRSDSNQSQQDR